MYSLTINTNRYPIVINFSDMNKFKLFVQYQLGTGHFTNIEEFLIAVENKLNYNWKNKETFFDIQKTSIILDIGSGVGFFDIILSKYLNNNSTFYLLDKNCFNKKNKHWGFDHGFYNNWSVFHDIATCSDINLNNFVLLSPEDNWPEHIDLIMSNYSYMWHYDKDVYWDKILPYAKNSCRLGFDILNKKDRDFEKEISNELNKNPTSMVYYPFPYYHWYVNELYNKNQTYGKFCVWK